MKKVWKQPTIVKMNIATATKSGTLANNEVNNNGVDKGPVS